MFGLISPSRLYGVVALISRPDAYCVIDRQDEYLAVSSLASPGFPDDSVQRFAQVLIQYHGLDFHLGQELYPVFTCSPRHAHTPLPPPPAHLCHCHPQYPNLSQRCLDGFQLLGSDDGFNLFHPDMPPYALSPCCDMSSPTTSSSSLTLSPMITSTILPSTQVETKAKAPTAASPASWLPN